LNTLEAYTLSGASAPVSYLLNEEKVGTTD
jgi:hypothetical protein